jgi:hypothetical protein
VAGCCEHGDAPSGSGATELVCSHFGSISSIASDVEASFTFSLCSFFPSLLAQNKGHHKVTVQCLASSRKLALAASSFTTPIRQFFIPTARLREVDTNQTAKSLVQIGKVYLPVLNIERVMGT